jgi:hypothetical protein
LIRCGTDMTETQFRYQTKAASRADEGCPLRQSPLRPRGRKQGPTCIW